MFRRRRSAPAEELTAAAAAAAAAAAPTTNNSGSGGWFKKSSSRDNLRRPRANSRDAARVAYTPSGLPYQDPAWMTHLDVPSASSSSKNTKKAVTNNSNGGTQVLCSLLIKNDWPAAAQYIDQEPNSCKYKDHIMLQGQAVKAYPLHVAVTLGAPTFLIERILNLHPTALKVADEATGRLPLHWACLASLPPVVLSALVAGYGSAVRVPDQAGCLPLHYICQNATTLRQVQILLGGGSSSTAIVQMIQHKDATGQTPIHKANDGKSPIWMEIVAELRDALIEHKTPTRTRRVSLESNHSGTRRAMMAAASQLGESPMDSGGHPPRPPPTMNQSRHAGAPTSSSRSVQDNMMDYSAYSQTDNLKPPPGTQYRSSSPYRDASSALRSPSPIEHRKPPPVPAVVDTGYRSPRFTQVQDMPPLHAGSSRYRSMSPAASRQQVQNSYLVRSVSPTLGRDNNLKPPPPSANSNSSAARSVSPTLSRNNHEDDRKPPPPAYQRNATWGYSSESHPSSSPVRTSDPMSYAQVDSIPTEIRRPPPRPPSNQHDTESLTRAQAERSASVGQQLMDDMNQNIQELKQKISRQEGMVREKEEQMQGVKTQLDQVGAEHDSVQRTFESEQSALMQTNSLLVEKRQRVNDIRRTISRLQNELASEMGEIGRLEQSVPALESAVAGTSSKLNAVRDEQSSLVAIHEALNEEKESLSLDFTNWQSELMSLKAIQNLAMGGNA